MEQYEAPNYEWLAYFDAVNSCVDVDAVSAEHCQHPHVTVIKEAKVNSAASK